MEDKKSIRIKVNKGVDKRVVIFNLTAEYLGILGLFLIVSIILLINNFSIKKFSIVLTLFVIVYFIIQYLSAIDYLQNRKKSKIPDELYNDLY